MKGHRKCRRSDRLQILSAVSYRRHAAIFISNIMRCLIHVKRCDGCYSAIGRVVVLTAYDILQKRNKMMVFHVCFCANKCIRTMISNFPSTRRMQRPVHSRCGREAVTRRSVGQGRCALVCGGRQADGLTSRK